MRQLLLDWGAEKPQTLATFVAGRNAELVQLMRSLACRCGDMPEQRFVYLWGEPGAGKTHLLRALASSGCGRYIGGGADPDAFEYAPLVSRYLLDDCDSLPAEAQAAAFGLYNQVRENGGIWVAAGAAPPAALPLREDLRTRLGWGLVYQVHGLSDEEKIAALSQAAAARGFEVAPAVLAYLITHLRRDMRSLSATLDALDRYSLETKRPITLPLLRSLLELEGETR
jgi:DnaA family protein